MTPACTVAAGAAMKVNKLKKGDVVLLYTTYEDAKPLKVRDIITCPEGDIFIFFEGDYEFSFEANTEVYASRSGRIL